ncbi:SseB family protein [Streptomyces sp. NBC_00006]|uniref:SseB family protein n=1 Tax=unclassified Streptomyces TaxID=2593676 RepID=UPI00224ECECB|nr:MULTISPECIES: SseB family protein [unclassified Streptomyces]MCX4831715.1 SseB family protein [Streptomyces sp. NBC_01016]MCX5536232.1 SseB family protein [Streptomyces sp. NBC_00006]
MDSNATPQNGSSPAQQALSALSMNTEDQGALDALAECEVLVPVPDEVGAEQDAASPGLSLPVIEQPGGEQLVPLFTSELRMSELLPFISRCTPVPLGALAASWPTELSMTIDAGSPDALTLNGAGVRELLGHRT